MLSLPSPILESLVEEGYWACIHQLIPHLQKALGVVCFSTLLQMFRLALSRCLEGPREARRTVFIRIDWTYGLPTGTVMNHLPCLSPTFPSPRLISSSGLHPSDLTEASLLASQQHQQRFQGLVYEC